MSQDDGGQERPQRYVPLSHPALHEQKTGQEDELPSRHAPDPPHTRSDTPHPHKTFSDTQPARRTPFPITHTVPTSRTTTHQAGDTLREARHNLQTAACRHNLPADSKPVDTGAEVDNRGG